MSQLGSQLSRPLSWLITDELTNDGTAINTVSNYNFKAFIIIAVGLLLSLPSLFSGLFADDYSQALLVQQVVSHSSQVLVEQPQTPTLANLFTFVTPEHSRRVQLIEHGLLPWWAAKDFSMVFFRPLAEFTHIIDYGYLKHPELMHLHSLLWYGLALLLLAMTFRRLLATKLALLALLFFALDSTHTFTVSWLANRNALMALVFSLCALLAFRAYCLVPKLRYLLTLLLSLILAFLSAEAGVIAGVLLLSFSLFYRRGGALENSEISLQRVVLPLTLAFLVFISWLSLYQHWGFGASGNSAYYADPIAEPWVYLKNFPERFFIAMSMLFNFLPWHLNANWLLMTQVSGVVIFVLIAVFIIRENKPHLNFSACLIVLSIVPVASAEMQDRNLLFANIGSSIILAELCFFLAAYISSKKMVQAKLEAKVSCYNAVKSYAAKALVWLILIFHLGLSALFIVPMSYAPALLAKPAKQSVDVLQHELLTNLNEKFVEESPSLLSSQLVFTVGMPLFTSAYIIPMQAYFYPPKALQTAEVVADKKLSNKLIPRVFINLTSDANAVVKRVQALEGYSQSFTVASEQGLFSGPDTLLRDVSVEPFTVGERIELSVGFIEIASLNEAGVVQAVKLHLKAGIAENAVAVYRWLDRPRVRFESIF